MRLAAFNQRARTIGTDARFGQFDFTGDIRIVAIVRHDDLGHQDAARRRHEGGGEQEGQIVRPEQPGISGKDRPRHTGHADGHQREQPRRWQRSEIGPHHQWAFRLADEYIGRRAQRFDLADTRHPADRPADPAHHPLHDAEIIEDRNQRREEHDHRERAERKGVGERVVCAEQEVGAFIGIAEQGRHAIGHPLDHPAAPVGRQYEERHQRLQREGRADHPRLDAFLPRRKQEGDGKDGEDAEQAGKDGMHMFVATDSVVDTVNCRLRLLSRASQTGCPQAQCRVALPFSSAWQ